MLIQIEANIEQESQQEMTNNPLIGATILFTIAEGLQLSATVCEVSICIESSAFIIATI